PPAAQSQVQAQAQPVVQPNPYAQAASHPQAQAPQASAVPQAQAPQPGSPQPGVPHATRDAPSAPHDPGSPVASSTTSASASSTATHTDDGLDRPPKNMLPMYAAIALLV